MKHYAVATKLLVLFQTVSANHGNFSCLIKLVLSMDARQGIFALKMVNAWLVTHHVNNAERKAFQAVWTAIKATFLNQIKLLLDSA